MIPAALEMVWIWELKNCLEESILNRFLPMHFFFFNYPFIWIAPAHLLGSSHSPRFPRCPPAFLLIIPNNCVFLLWVEQRHVTGNLTLGCKVQVRCACCTQSGLGAARESVAWREHRGDPGRVPVGRPSALLPTTHSLEGRSRQGASVAITTPLGTVVFLKLRIVEFCLLKC